MSMDKRLKTLNPALKRYQDVLELVIIYEGGKTLLPELYNVFGKELFIKFLDIFSGCEFKVPTLLEFERWVRDVDVYLNLLRSRNNLKSMGTKYGLGSEMIYYIYNKVSDAIDSVTEAKDDKWW